MTNLEKINENYKVILDNNHETCVLINNHKLRFIKSAHKYFVDSVEVPSVSLIMKYILEDIYKDIDDKIIKKASKRGEVLHYEIENYEKTGLKGFSEEFNNYLKVKEELNLNVLKSELFVLFCNGDVPLFAGRIDLACELDNKLGLIDIKRTFDLHLDRVGLQLNLYKLAFEQSFSLKLDFISCLRLRESIKEFTNIKIETLDTIEKIDNYRLRNVKNCDLR